MVPTDLRLRFHAPRTSRPVSSLTLAGGSGDYRYGIVDWPTRARDDYDMTTAARTTVNIWAVQLARNVPAFAKVLGKRAAETEERTKRVEDLAPPSTPTCDDWAALTSLGLSSGGSPTPGIQTCMLVESCADIEFSEV